MTALGQKARSAVIWNTGFNLFRDGLQFGVMLVLVRLLPPEAYGQFGLVTSLIGFIAIFSFNQFVAHTLQVRNEADLNYQVHFTAGAIINLLMFGVTNLAAVGLRYSVTYAPVAQLVHVMSLTFLLEWPCEFRRKMIEREFDWRRLRLLHGAGLIFSTVLALTMAWSGAGVYALLVPGMTVTVPFIWDLFITKRWRPTWRWSWQEYRTALHFGLARIGSGLATNGRLLTESATIAKVFGYAPLGILNRSVGLAQMCCSKFAVQLLYAIYPLLTRLDTNSDNQARVNGLVLRLVAWFVIPVATLFSTLAHPVVSTVYGQQWLEVVPLLPWAMLSGAGVALAHTTNYLLLAQQRPKRCLAADCLALAGTLAALALAMPIGLKAYLGATGALNLGLAGLMSLWLWRAGVLRMGGIAQAILPSSFAAVGALIVSELLRHAIGVAICGLAQGATYGVGFSILYLMILRATSAHSLSEILRYVPGSTYVSRILLIRC